MVKVPAEKAQMWATRSPQQQATIGSTVLAMSPHSHGCSERTRKLLTCFPFNITVQVHLHALRQAHPSLKTFTVSRLAHSFIPSTQRQEQEDLWELKASLVY